MRAILAQGLDVGDAQLFTWDTHAAQAEILGDGVVLAIASALDQGLDGRGPIVDFTPQVDVFHIAQLLVEKQVGCLQAL
ncbi:hypothetical protein D3C73_1260800 [compost metagenome]